MARCLQTEMYNREFDTIAVTYRLHKKTKENEEQALRKSTSDKRNSKHMQQIVYVK